MDNLLFLQSISLCLLLCCCQKSSQKERIYKKSLKNYQLTSFQNQRNSQEDFSSWSEWSKCDRRCTKTRKRLCLNTETCVKKVIKQSKQCRSCLATRRRRHHKLRRDKAKEMDDTVYDILYGEWSGWSPCTRSCKKRRYRSCANKKICRGTVLMEHKTCSHPNSNRCKRMITRNKKRQKNKKGSSHRSEDYDKKNRESVEHSSSSVNMNGNHFKNCGMRNVSARTRIIGGQESRYGSWPWQVAIMTQWKEQYCGGVMISDNWVLTAAHCLRRRMRRVIIRIGEHDFEADHGSEQDFKINKNTAILHPDFNMEDIDSDIALIKLKEPIRNKQAISYACLPEKNDILLDNTMCYVVGWGKTKETHLFGTDVLREARVPLVSRGKCENAFDFTITKNQMCAGVRHGGMDTCAGDSGGPLMCQINKNGEKRWYVYGITSFGEGCGDRGKYGIYTIVRNFYDWIQGKITDNTNYFH